MATNSGTLVISSVRPNDSLDTYPVAICNEIKGGHHSYPTLIGLYSIPVLRRQAGMFGTVTNNPEPTFNNTYVLQNDLITWAYLNDRYIMSADLENVNTDQILKLLISSPYQFKVDKLYIEADAGSCTVDTIINIELNNNNNAEILWAQPTYRRPVLSDPSVQIYVPPVIPPPVLPPVIPPVIPVVIPVVIPPVVQTIDRYLVIRMASYYDPWIPNPAIPSVNVGKLPLDLHFIGIVPYVAVLFQQPARTNFNGALNLNQIFQLVPSPSSLYSTTNPLTENAIGSSIAIHNGVIELQIDTEQWAGDKIDIRCLPVNYRRRFELGVDTLSTRPTLTPPTRVEFEVESRNFRNLQSQPVLGANASQRTFAEFTNRSVFTGEQEPISPVFGPIVGVSFGIDPFTGGTDGGSPTLIAGPGVVMGDVLYRVAFRVSYDKTTGAIQIT